MLNSLNRRAISCRSFSSFMNPLSLSCEGAPVLTPHKAKLYGRVP
jgi:hypothetical protein